MKQIILLLLLFCISCERYENNTIIGTEWNNYSIFHYQVLNFESLSEGVLHIDVNNKVSSKYFTYKIIDNNIYLNFGIVRESMSGVIYDNRIEFTNNLIFRKR